MQKQNNKNLIKNKKELDTLDRFLRILWRREVEYKINIYSTFVFLTLKNTLNSQCM